MRTIGIIYLETNRKDADQGARMRMLIFRLRQKTFRHEAAHFEE